MKIDSIDKVTSFDSSISEPLGNEDKSIMTTKKTAGLSDLNYTPYKPINITGQAKKAYNYYLNRGVKPNVAAGIVGNLYKESGLNPNAVGDKGTAFGVAQWRGNRLSNLKNYASSKGRSYTDLNTQLDFILDEKGENQVLTLMGNQSPEVAAKTFADKYERPNPKYADYSTRSSVAKQLGQMKYGGKIQLYPDGGNLKSLPTDYFDKWYRKGRIGQLVNSTKDVYQKIKNDGKNLYNIFDKQYPTNNDKLSAITNLTGYVPNPYVAIPSAIINTGLDIAGLEDKSNAIDLASNVMQIGLKKRTRPLKIAGKVLSSAMDLGNPSNEQLDNKSKITKKALGGFIPKHALGAGEIMGLISQGMNLGAGFIDSTNDPENPNIAKSGISGFIKGNAALPGIGGILGGIAGIRDAKKQRELFQKKKDIENRGVMDYFNIRSKGILDNYNTQGEEGSFYAKGGIPNPQYEVEHGEVIVGDDVKLTGGKQLASNLHKVVGKTHDQFNPNTVNGTGEDGQGGQFIFSNRLKLGGKTFAKLAEGVAKQKAKAEEMMSHNDYIFKNTGQANAEIADAKLMQLAQIQEMMKGETNALGQFKYGGHIPQFGPGGNPSAGAKIGGKVSMKIPPQYRGIKALEYARKAAPNLTFEQLKSLVGKAGVTVDDLKTFAKNPVNRIATNVASQTATNVGRNLPAVITNTAVGNVGKQSFLGTVGKVLGAGAESITKILNSPLGMLRPGLPSDFSKEKFAYELTMKYGDEEAKKRASKIFNADKLDKVNPNELTIPERRALRNAIPTSTPSAPTTPQGTNRPSGNRLNLNKNKVNPLATENANLPVQSGNSQPNQFTGTVEPYSVNLPKEEIDFSYSVQGNNNFSPIRKVREKGSGINTDDLAPVAGALMSGINYFANQNMINKYKTQTPATLLQNPNYQYFDRSGNARASVRGITNSIMNNPILNQGTKQAALANSMNVMNEVNQQELNRKQEYDRSYRGQQLETENRNAMILNQARQQTMQNENQKQGLRQDNLNNLFSNINTNLAEFQANKQQDKAMQYMSLPYFKRLGLTPTEQEQFKKNPTSFLMGQNEVEVPKNKKGGRIKMKYC